MAAGTTDTTAPIKAWDLRAGMLVRNYSGKLYRVVKVLKVNVRCEDENGQQWNIRLPGPLYRVPEGTPFGGAPVEEAFATFYPGEVVRYKEGDRSSSRNKRDPRVPHVIIGSGVADVKMAPLGGDTGLYRHGVPKTAIEKITVAEALVMINERAAGDPGYDVP